jgi:hypothetical protein
MGHRRRDRGRYDGDHRRGAIVEEHGLSVSAVALALTLLGCHEVDTRTVFFKVTNPVMGCKINDCAMMTLQCVGSVRAVLTPENGMAVMGQCMTPGATSATLCDPTRLFPQPLFDQIPGGRVSLKIIGYKDANCTDSMQLFETHTGVFDVAAAANMSTPVTMSASCTAADGMLCDQVLNVQGNIVGWPPNMQRDPPNISGVNYQVGFGYVVPPAMADTPPTFTKLFDVTYNPLPTAGHSLTGVGVLPQDLKNPYCIGYQATAIPAQGITTLTCFSRAQLTGTVQALDAYYLSPEVAGAAMAVWGNTGGGILLGQVTRNGIGLQGAIVSAADASGPLTSDRLLYYAMSSHSFSPGNMTDGTGLFAIKADGTGAATVILGLQAASPVAGSTPTAPAQIILPRQATLIDLKL